ncbi:MAG: hypothetical protein SFV53_00125 [Rickettsiales bacterium]|nr:hypothetical protein [Rickettsiales bacterium]
MKNFFLTMFLLFISACENVGISSCMQPSQYYQNEAQSYYETFGTSLVSDELHQKLRKKFACYYRAGDKIYAYKTLWNTKYVLVRHGTAITYIDSD